MKGLGAFPSSAYSPIDGSGPLEVTVSIENGGLIVRWLGARNGADTGGTARVPPQPGER